jgi:tetratricopeptide (TPR) repeat protein
VKPTFKRGIQFFNQKRFEQAKKELLSLEQRPDENPEIAYYLGLIHTQLKEYDNAIMYLEQVVLSHQNMFNILQCRMILGFIYSVTGRFRLAEMEFRHLINLGVESPQVYASIGYTLYAQKKIGECIKNLQKALKLKPDYAGALNNLGYIYAEEGLNYKEAIELCKKAAKLNPKNPVYLDSLGWAYFKKGNLVDAKEYLRKALELSKGNREIANHLRSVISKAKSSS